MEDACATGAFTAQAVLHDMGLPTEHIMTALGVRLSSYGLQHALAAWRCGAPPLPSAVPTGELKKQVVLTR
jgi:hypothetical protein